MSKYGATIVWEDGYCFRSKKEYNHYKTLQALQRVGAISELEVHPSFVLQDGFQDKMTGVIHREIKYEADFSYREPGNNHLVVEDVKGMYTKVFILKMKMFRYKYPDLDFRIIK